MEKLVQVAQKDRCRFLPISANPQIHDKYAGRFPRIPLSVFVLLSAANNDIAEGRADRGIEEHLCVLKMADHLRQQPTVIFPMVGIAMEDKVLPLLNRFIVQNQIGDEQLRLLVDSIGSVENEWKTDWTKMVNFEKLYAKNYFSGTTYEINTEGEIRLNRGRSRKGNKLPQEIPQKTYLDTKLGKGRVIPAWFYCPSSPETIAEITDVSFEKYYAMAEPDSNWDCQVDDKLNWKLNFRSIVQSLINENENNYRRIHEIYLKNISLRRGWRLLVAIKQYYDEHGAWPPNLDAIKSAVPAEAFVDPVTENPLEYENHGERFSLYGATVNVGPQ